MSQMFRAIVMMAPSIASIPEETCLFQIVRCHQSIAVLSAQYDLSSFQTSLFQNPVSDQIMPSISNQRRQQKGLD
jgi:hypothetical protein